MLANGAVRPLAHWTVCGLVLVVAGCNPAATPVQSPPRPASPATYPDLATVPPRPVLDPIGQRRELQNELVSDRQNANFRAAELAYATGRAAAPPPRPAPTAAPPAAAPVPRQPPGGDGAVARAYLDSSLNDIRDRGKLRQFMRRLGREAPDPVGAQTLAQAVGLAALPPGATPTPPAQPQPGTLDYLGDYLRGVFGLSGEAAD